MHHGTRPASAAWARIVSVARNRNPEGMTNPEPSPIPPAVRRAGKNAELLYHPAQVEQALERMAAAIIRDLAGSDPLVLCVLLGGLVPTGRLLPRLSFPLQLDYVHLERYRGEIRGGSITWFRRPGENVRGRTVLIVDDILDRGDTLAAVADECRHHGAGSVRIAVLAAKDFSEDPSERVVREKAPRADYVGLRVPDRYVVGGGMDYRGYLRNEAGLYALSEER